MGGLVTPAEFWPCTLDEGTMKTELGKWNPFKFLRKSTADVQSRGEPPDLPAPKHWSPDRLDASDLFSGDPWRAMGEFLHEPMAGFRGLDRWFGDFSSSRFQPRIDVVDDGSTLRITAELPGMDREDLETTIEEGALVLRGEKKQDIRSEESGCYRLERAYGYFMRSIPLPDGVDIENVEAKFDQGVLTLQFPKLSSSQPVVRKIQV